MIKMPSIARKIKVKFHPSTKVLKVLHVASQHEIEHLEHARSACGITCLWMVLRYLDPNFGTTLQELHDQERKNEWHFRPKDRVWLQHGSAEFARKQNFKAKAINLFAMGTEPQDLDNMRRTGRISEREIEDYIQFHLSLAKVRRRGRRIKRALKYFLDRDLPVMVGVRPGFSVNGSNHRIIVLGYDGRDFIVVDPVDHHPAYKRVSLYRLAKYATGNILVVYKDEAKNI